MDMQLLYCSFRHLEDSLVTYVVFINLQSLKMEWETYRTCATRYLKSSKAEHLAHGG